MKKHAFFDFLLLTTLWTAILCGPLSVALFAWQAAQPTPLVPAAPSTRPAAQGYGYSPANQAAAPASAAPDAQRALMAGEMRAGAFNITGAGTYRLYSSIGSSQTTITLASFKEPVSNVLYTMSYINTTIGYGTIDPNSSSISEFVSFSGITQNSDGTATLTGVTRGLSRTPGTGGCVASTTLAEPHSGQAIFILSNSPCFQNQYAVKGNDETITGTWTFTNFPITPHNGTSSETVAGVVQLGTAAQAAAGTAFGSTGARLVLSTSLASSSYATSTAPNKIIMTGASGALDLNFLGTTTIAFPSYATTTFATSSIQIGAFPAWQIGKQSQIFSSTGTTTFAVPSGITDVSVTVVGAGGGGGGGASASSKAGGGGGGGGCSVKNINVSGTTSIQVFVGSGGTGSSGAVGTAGTWSTFGTNGSYISATGGGAGAFSGVASGGAGGVGANGDINMAGNDGAPSYYTGAFAGSGGSSCMGGGGGGQNAQGNPGGNYGGGGAGCFIGSGSCAGNAGAQGIVIVRW